MKLRPRLPAHVDVGWQTDPAVLEAHRFDRSGWTPDVSPAAVASPRTVDGVRHVLEHAHRSRTPWWLAARAPDWLARPPPPTAVSCSI